MVISFQFLYLSSPMTCFAYRLVSATTFVCRSSEKKSSKTSSEVPGIETTGDVQSLIVTGEFWVKISG